MFLASLGAHPCVSLSAPIGHTDNSGKGTRNWPGTELNRRRQPCAVRGSGKKRLMERARGRHSPGAADMPSSDLFVIR